MATTTATPSRYFTDKQLLAHFQECGTPLPFGLVRLIQDRKNGRLGGVPYRQLGDRFVYNPGEVSRWLDGLPIIQAKPTKAIKTGRPTVGEKAKADRLGISVKTLRGGAA